MSLLPLPDKSYPVDTNYMYLIVDAINKLGDQVNRAAGSSSHQGKPVATTALQVVTKTIQVVNNRNVSSGESVRFVFDYPDFYDVPVVVFTATVAGTNAGRSVYVTKSNSGKTSTTGYLKIQDTGVMTITVDAIAIGLPPTYRP